MDALGCVTCAVLENRHITMIVDLFSMSKMDALVNTIVLVVRLLVTRNMYYGFSRIFNCSLNYFFHVFYWLFLIGYSLVSLASAKSNK